MNRPTSLRGMLVEIISRARVRDLLEVAQRRLRADLLQHRVHDALLARHPRVVVGALAGAGEPERVEPSSLRVPGSM